MHVFIDLRTRKNFKMTVKNLETEVLNMIHKYDLSCFPYDMAEFLITEKQYSKLVDNLVTKRGFKIGSSSEIVNVAGVDITEDRDVKNTWTKEIIPISYKERMPEHVYLDLERRINRHGVVDITCCNDCPFFKEKNKNDFLGRCNITGYDLTPISLSDYVPLCREICPLPDDPNLKLDIDLLTSKQAKPQ